jgi:hypothetical protein
MSERGSHRDLSCRRDAVSWTDTQACFDPAALLTCPSLLGKSVEPSLAQDRQTSPSVSRERNRDRRVDMALGASRPHAWRVKSFAKPSL